MIKIENRASTVLFKFLIGNCKGYHFFIPANVCSVVPLTFIKAGVDFSFIDIDKETHAASFTDVLMGFDRMNNPHKGLLYVNSYGAKHETQEFYEDLKRKYPCTCIIEDNCLCIPETNRTEPIAYVDLELYSTGYSKYVQLPRGGGYGFLAESCFYPNYIEEYNEEGYGSQLKIIRSCRNSKVLFSYTENHWLPTQFDMIGFSEKDYINKVIIEIQKSKEHKRVINYIYDSILPSTIKMSSLYNNWRYNIIIKDQKLRDAILEDLRNNGLYASTHYASAAYLYHHQYCPNTEIESNRILNLFNEIKYSEDMAEQTAFIIKKYVIT